jgi:hypothetical protein
MPILLAASPFFGIATRQEPLRPVRQDRIDFGEDVRPIFEQHCYGCHGPVKQESGFRLDIRSRALGTADIGQPPIVPGNASHSPLIQFVAGTGDLVMPPEGSGDRLDQHQLEILRQWIDQGAKWPDELAGLEKETITTDHWSFQTVHAHQPPTIDHAKLKVAFSLENGIDCFIAQQLLKNGIQPSAPADRVALIRRVYLDMHGLHPTPEQVKAFVGDQSANAVGKLIDDVLASHHYGERWARHWLDVVRFGESTGYEVNRDRPNAYYYRDYVIDALNGDKSYRDFIVEQIAGDVVGVDEATGFLVCGPYDVVKSPDINLTLMQRQDELADYVHATSSTFLGLTVSCARCHNHKFDPILQRDYYQMQAVFAGVEHGERQLLNRASAELRESLTSAQSQLEELERQFDKRRATAPRDRQVAGPLFPMVDAKLNTDVFDPVVARFVRFTVRQTNQAEPCIDELEIFSVADENSAEPSTNVALATLGSIATSSGNYAGDPKHELEHINDGKYGNSFSWISDTVGIGWVQIELAMPTAIERVIWARDREQMYQDRLPVDYSIAVSNNGQQWKEVSSSDRRQPFLIDGKELEGAFIGRLPAVQAAQARSLFEQIAQLRGEISRLGQEIPTAYVGTFKQPEPIHRLYRGDPFSPREEVVPDILTVLGSLNLDRATAEQQRRLKLARWIASEENPLTARVIVNRVWQYHFGHGIVPTASDFGKNGMPPSHPQLLDWLARRFMQNGWSLKWLHREILSSSTYRQSSRPRGDALEKDAQCLLLWRFPPRRLEAEAIRDCVLQLSGKLNPQTGGPGFLLFKVDRENVHHYFPLDEFESEHFRRMIYMTKIRQEQDDVFGTFDCPDGGQTIPQRARSTTALQALNLLNSRFMVEQAEFLADRLKESAGVNPIDQVRLAFELAFSRSPTSEEVADAVQLITEHGLQAFCRALLNSNEFLFMS